MDSVIETIEKDIHEKRKDLAFNMKYKFPVDDLKDKIKQLEYALEKLKSPRVKR